MDVTWWREYSDSGDHVHCVVTNGSETIRCDFEELDKIKKELKEKEN